MSAIHKFQPDGTSFKWGGARSRRYRDADDVRGVTENWLVGKAEDARNFAIRYYEVAPGGFSHAEEHAHDHGVVLLRGKARLILNDEEFVIEPFDVAYISPNDFHQLVNIGEEPMGFLCVIPAHRQKKGKDVWAEDGISDLSST